MNLLCQFVTLLGCLVSRSFVAGQCTTCAAYTAPSDTTDCGTFKTYISCMFVNDNKECPGLPTDQTEIKKIDPTQCTHALGKLCLCEANYYSANLDDKPNKCNAIKAMDVCVGNAADGSCDLETKEQLNTFVTKKKKLYCDEVNHNNLPSGDHGTRKPVTSTPVTKECTAHCTPPGTDDTACTNLENYIDCIENANAIGECVPKANELKTPKKCEASLKDTCKCQADYWETDFTEEKQPCKALKAFSSCLSSAKETKGCKDKTKDDLKKNVDETIKVKKCTNSSGLTAVSSTTGLVLALLVTIFSV